MLEVIIKYTRKPSLSFMTNNKVD